MNLLRIIYSDIGRYAISILLGLGIATLFRQSCKDKSCLLFRGATPDKVNDQIFKYDNKCYTFKGHREKRNDSKTIVNFA
jgi:hypothetical protein